VYGTVLIPPAVFEELKLRESRPGAAALAGALREAWLIVEAPRPSPDMTKLEMLLDSGEAEAVVLSRERNCRFLLIDNRKGRKVARRWGVAVVGTGGVLHAAKASGHLEAITPALDDLARVRYRLSADLVTALLKKAGE
jgi:predicted nucleic acid-binding protein